MNSAAMLQLIPVPEAPSPAKPSERSAAEEPSSRSFDDVLQQASDSRRTEEQQKTSETTRDDQSEVRAKDDDREVENKDERDGEDKKEVKDAKAPEDAVKKDVQPVALVVEGGINMMLSSTDLGQGSELADVGTEAAPTLVTANGAGQPVDAALAAAQAKAEALARMQGQAQAQGEAQTQGQAQAAEQPQVKAAQQVVAFKTVETPDQGADVEAKVDAPTADAAEESFKSTAAEAGRPKGELNNLLKKVGEGDTDQKAEQKPVEQPLVGTKVLEVVPDKQVQVKLEQPVQGGNAEQTQPVQSVTGLERVGAKTETSTAAQAAKAVDAPEPTVNRQQVVDQIVRSAKLSLDRGMTRFEMRLEPPSLGKVGVTMDLKDGNLSITFKVEHQAVKEALQNSLPQLREALAGQGLNVDSCDVQGSGRGLQQQGDGNRQEPAFERSSGGYGSDAGLPEEEPAPRGYETVRSAAGGLDFWA